MAKTVADFINYAKGKEFDGLGRENNVGYVQYYYPYAGQCVSLIQAYMKYFGQPVAARGNAIDWWNNFNSNGLSKYFTRSSTPKDGAVFVSTGSNGFGHVGIYWKGQGLQQNVSNNPYARLLPIYDRVVGYLIPKFVSATDTNQTLWTLTIIGGVIVSAKKQ